MFEPAEERATTGRAWRVERDERIRARVDEVGDDYSNRQACFQAVAEEFTEGGEPVSARTVERAYWGR